MRKTGRRSRWSEGAMSPRRYLPVVVLVITGVIVYLLVLFGAQRV
jgi:hypothetical protein